MWAKMKLNPARYRLTAAVLFPRVVLILLGSVVLHGCIRVSLEGLPEAVETAMKRSVIRHKTEIVQKVGASVDGLGVAQMRRLNRAEQQYAKAVRFKGMVQPNPMKLGFLFKSRRNFHAHEVVDVRDTGSLIHDPYEVIVAYKYEVWETQRLSSGDPTSEDLVKKDSDFQKIDQNGSIRFRYRFNADLEWNGAPAVRLWTGEVPASLAPASIITRPVAAQPAAPPPSQKPPAQDDLPVPITQIGGPEGPPPRVLTEGLRKSPLLKGTPRRKRSLD
jgi:hypothetical protein